MDSATPRRVIGETPPIRPWDAVNGTYPGIGGDGRAYEDEKAAFASRSCIGNFREARSTTLRPDTPSGCVKKNVSRDHGSQIEHLEPHRTRIQRRKHPKNSSTWIDHVTWSSNVHAPFGPRPLSSSRTMSNYYTEYVCLWRRFSFGTRHTLRQLPSLHGAPPTPTFALAGVELAFEGKRVAVPLAYEERRYW